MAVADEVVHRDGGAEHRLFLRLVVCVQGLAGLLGELRILRRHRLKRGGARAHKGLRQRLLIGLLFRCLPLRHLQLQRVAFKLLLPKQGILDSSGRAADVGSAAHEAEIIVESH